MQLVNGYVCHDCTDVDLARKGIDPAKPRKAPGAPDADARDRHDPTMTPRADPTGLRGTHVDVYA